MLLNVYDHNIETRDKQKYFWSARNALNQKCVMNTDQIASKVLTNVAKI